MAMSGTVKFFNGERGYGFIKPDDGGRATAKAPGRAHAPSSRCERPDSRERFADASLSSVSSAPSGRSLLVAQSRSTALDDGVFAASERSCYVAEA